MTHLTEIQALFSTTTVAHLQQFQLRQIVSAHCTGWRALHALLHAFGESAVTPSVVGSRVTF